MLAADLLGSVRAVQSQRILETSVENVEPAPSQGHKRPDPAPAPALSTKENRQAKVGVPQVGRIIGLENPMSDVVFVRTPDGHSQIELVKHLAAPDPRGP